VLADWQERADQGDELTPDDLLREHPELADELREQFVFLGLLDRARPAAELPDGAPREIGDFRIVRELGRGGMGVVYEAIQESMDRRVALKVLSLTITGSPNAVKRFQREAKAAGRLHHTNIVPIHAMGQYAGYWYYAMELVEGRPLSDVVAQLRAGDSKSEESLAKAAAGEPTSPTSTAIEELGTNTSDRSYFVRVAEMFGGVADALALAHDEQIVHRDIKPSNLLLDADGTLKIVDFGLARVDDGGMTMTMTGDLLGTPAYMSPEQAMAKRMSIDHRTDIYSLGATMYEVLTLRPPFSGKTLQEICSQIITKDPANPRRRNARIPRDLETIVLKAMEKDRDKRYASAAELAHDLRRFADGIAVHARRVSPVGRAWRKVKRHKVRSSLVAAVAVLAFAGGWLAVHAADEAARRRDLEYARLVTRVELAVGFSGGLQRPDEHPDLEPGKQAILELDEAIELDPDRPDAYWMRALTPGRTIEQRLDDIERAHERGLSKRSFHLMRAFVLQTYSHQPENAKRERDQAVLSGKPSLRDDYFEARLLDLPTEFPRALELLDRVIAQSDSQSTLRQLAVRCRAWVRMLHEDDSGALQDLHALEAFGQSSSTTQYYIARCWKRLGRKDLAERLFAELIAPNRELGDWGYLHMLSRYWRELDWLDRSTAASLAQYRENTEALNWRGIALLSLGRHREAIDVHWRAVELDPENPSLRANHATALSEAGRYQEALEIYIELDKQELPAHVRASVALNRGVALFKTGRAAEALSALEHAQRLGADETMVLTNRGLALASLGQHEEALRVYGEAIKLNENADMHANRAISLIILRRWADVDEALDRAVEMDPTHASAYYQRSRAYTERLDYESARAPIEKAIALSKTPQVHFLSQRSMVLIEQGELDQAEANARRAIALIEDYLLAHVRSEAHFQLSNVLRAKGEFDGALAAIDRALELNPNLLTRRARASLLGHFRRTAEALAARQEIVAETDEAWDYNELGFQLRNARKLQESLAAFDAAVQRAPSDTSFRFNRAEALWDVKRYATSLEDVAVLEKTAMAETAGLHLVKARGLEGLQQWPESLAAIEKALSLPKPSPHCYPLQVNMLLQLERPAEALSAADKAMRIAPSPALEFHRARALVALDRYSDAVSALDALGKRLGRMPAAGYYFRAKCFKRMKRWAEARQSFELALRGAAPGRRAMFANNLAWLLVSAPEGRDPKRAETLARQALKTDPDMHAARGTLGVALYRLERNTEAIETLRKALDGHALEKKVSRALDLYVIAMAQHKLGDTKAAKATFTQAQTIHKDGDETDELARFAAEAREVLGR